MRAEVQQGLQDLQDLYARPRRKAARDLAAQGEKDAARALPQDCPYAFDDLLADEWWPANRHGLRDDDERTPAIRAAARPVCVTMPVPFAGFPDGGRLTCAGGAP
jgi:hypothetical protein